MPTYVCTTRDGALSPKQRSAIAAAISKAHQEATGADAFFAQVVFDEKPSGRRFLGGDPYDAHIFVRGDVRAGRSPEQRRRLMEAITRDVASVADIAATDVWVYLCELEAADMIEYGHVLPEPGDEKAWFDGLPASLQTYLKRLGTSRASTERD